MARERSWRCADCGRPNPDTHPDGSPVGACRECYAWRPTGKAGRATVASDRVRAGDTVLGYTLDADLRPVRGRVAR